MQSTRSSAESLCGLTLQLLIALAMITARAQTTNGSIAGRVADASGGNLPDATVTITNKSTGAQRNTATFLMPSLPCR